MYVIVESVFILLLYVFGLRIFYHMRKNTLLIIDKTDVFRIATEYSLLLLSVIGRIVINIVSISPTIYDYKPNQNCSNSNDILNPSSTFQLTVLLILKHGMMHMLPILIVLYIYRPAVSQRLSELASEDSSAEGDTQYNYNGMYKRFYKGGEQRRGSVISYEPSSMESALQE